MDRNALGHEFVNPYAVLRRRQVFVMPKGLGLGHDLSLRDSLGFLVNDQGTDGFKGHASDGMLKVSLVEIFDVLK
jgi:hypothetical protein